MPDTHHVAGIVRQNGQGVAREIRVIDAATGALKATQSSSGGAFDIGLEDGDPVFVQAIPDAGFEPLIKGPVNPAPI